MSVKEQQNLPKSLRLPNILFVGPQRSGTTWIWEYLRARGDIVLPEGVKETWFFSSMFHKGVGWYASHFKPMKDYSAIIEVDPTLFSHPEAPRRVREILGSDVLIVITVRNPVERSWSHYLHARRYGWTEKPLEQAVQEIPDIIEASRYSKHIPRWKSVVGEKCVIILHHEALDQDPHSFVSDMCSAIGLPLVNIPERLLKTRVNIGRDVRSQILIRIATRLSNWLRSYQMYSVIDFVKRMGIRRMLYKPLNEGYSLHPRDKAMLFELLKEEYDFLSFLNSDENPSSNQNSRGSK